MRRLLVDSITDALERFYPTAKAYYMWRMRRTHEAQWQDPILVLQMGKVGSMSVQAGLEEQNLPRRIYHAHFLSTERTRQTEQERRKYFRTDRHDDLKRPWLNQYLLRQFHRDGGKRRWKIVTLTREPIARNLSAFFENLAVTELDEPGTYRIQSDYYGIEPVTVSTQSTSAVADLFFARARHNSPVQFFDREIKDIFGIDVLGQGFPQETGYGIYASDNADLLVLKLEMLRDCAAAAFDEFLGISDFRLVNRNVGAAKVYAPLYDATQKNIEIPAEYADRLYESRYMTTFYSASEIRSARERWLVE